MRVLTARIFSWAAVAALAGTGLMQGAEHGSFHLDTKVHWGGSVLPPGDYELVVPIPALGITQLQVIGNGINVFEVPVITASQAGSDSSHLKLLNINGEQVVTEYSSGATGHTYTFGVPKELRRAMESKRHEDSVAVGF
jgi:hypothetical protein